MTKEIKIIQPKIKETTKYKLIGINEMYCEFWECHSCKNSTYEASIYCPNCGKKFVDEFLNDSNIELEDDNPLT